jgi:hypothetical protein
MKEFKPYLYFAVFFFFWILLISQLWKYPIILLVILSVISVIYLGLKRSKTDLIIFLIAGISGPIGEGLVSASGLWTYHGETLLGIPYWLPLAWGITAVAVYKLVLAVTK